MKYILLVLITINIVFGGKCPPEELIYPCSCMHPEVDEIFCATPLYKIPNIFKAISENLKRPEDKHYDSVTLFLAPFNPDFHRSIQDNIFADVTFESFDSNFLEAIGPFAFNNTVDQIRYFYCDSCYLNFDPPNNIQNVLNQMKNLNTLEISLNVTEIPSRFIQPINDQSNLTRLQISSLHNNLTIKSEAIQNLNQLKYMTIVKTTIKRVEKDAFKIINNSNELSIIFEQCNLTGESFVNGSFDPQQKQMIIFLQTNISYLAENVFKPVLDNKSNIIDLISSTKLPKNSTIDCENCKNYWLIKNNKQNQVINARCKHNSMIKLFDQENQTKLSQKCK